MTSVSRKILDLVFELRNLTDSPATSVEAAEQEARQLAKIEAFVASGQPIHMILPAFPAKSPNPNKTVTHKPDYGEVLALERLNLLCARIASLHPAGAELTICSDGRVFSDVVHVADCAVDAYGLGIRRIIEERGLRHLSTYSLDDVFTTAGHDEMRQRLVSDFAESLEQVRARVKEDADHRQLFNGIHRFMFEDQMALQPERSKNWVREHAKGLAYEVIQRSNAWSRLVESKFPKALRLSIHPQPAHSAKIGVRLLPSSDRWRTPWHSVVVYDGKSFSLAPRAQAEAAGGVLTRAHGEYSYFVMPNHSEVAS